MRGRNGIHFDAHRHFGIFARITDPTNPSTRPKWQQIGTAKRNEKGFLDVTVERWPRNAKKIQIRPINTANEARGGFY